MFFQVVAQCFADSLVYGTGYFVVSQLRLGLPFELWLCHFNRDDRCQPFAEVVAGDFNLCFFKQLGVVGIFF